MDVILNYSKIVQFSPVQVIGGVSNWSLPACAPVQQVMSLCDVGACGCPGPGGTGSAACSTARRTKGPVKSPPAHLTQERKQTLRT